MKRLSELSVQGSIYWPKNFDINPGGAYIFKLLFEELLYGGTYFYRLKYEFVQSYGFKTGGKIV